MCVCHFWHNTYLLECAENKCFMAHFVNMSVQEYQKWHFWHISFLHNQIQIFVWFLDWY